MKIFKIIAVLGVFAMLASCEKVLTKPAPSTDAVAIFDEYATLVKEKYAMLDFKGVDIEILSDSIRGTIQADISDTDLFKNGKSYVSVSLPLVQNREYSMRIHSYFEGKKGKIDTRTLVNISQELNNQPHIAISVTKHRYRLWINEVKHVDIPRFIEKLDVLNYLKFNLNRLNEDEHLMIKNLKILKGGEDLRRQLISKGKISTNGILFDSGSANIQPQSLGIVRQISQVLMQDESIKLNIIGHTDADGSDVTNLELSKARAAAVKEALVSIYKISESRLTTDGKGETQPVGDNNTAEGKSKNRRVEFVKI